MQVISSRALLAILLYIISSSNIFANEDIPCDFYMARSTVAGAGRGIFAGKDLAESDLVEISPTLTVDVDFCDKWPLHNYVYSSNLPRRSLATFGMAMLYNHRSEEEKNVYHQWSEFKVFCDAETKSAQTTSTDVSYFAKTKLSAGDELFTSYGDDWFDARYIQVNDTKADSYFSRDLDYLKAHGVCMTHVYVSDSLIPLAGEGLFAKKRFHAGEVIYVSPVLLLPKHEVIDASNDSVLLNYCIAPLSEVDIAILPIGLSGNAYH
jgi:hypothetical protein